jgi:hypothetical protein
MIEFESRVTEEVVVRGAIDALRAHRYILSPDEAEHLVVLLTPYGDPEGIVDDINEALAYLKDSDEPNFEQAAYYLSQHLFANLMSSEEVVELENAESDELFTPPKLPRDPDKLA